MNFKKFLILRNETGTVSFPWYQTYYCPKIVSRTRPKAAPGGRCRDPCEEHELGRMGRGGEAEDGGVSRAAAIIDTASLKVISQAARCEY